MDNLRIGPCQNCSYAICQCPRKEIPKAMTNFTPTHVHTVTGEQFATGELNSDMLVRDKNGEHRLFDKSMLTPIQPIEEWEPVLNGYVSTNGILAVKLNDKWVELPHPDVRLVDGCRLERRKG